VDKETGQVKILKYVAAHDVGRAINPMLLEGTGLWWSHNGARVCFDREARPQGRQSHEILISLTTRCLTAKDVPNIEPLVIETNDSLALLVPRVLGTWTRANKLLPLPMPFTMLLG